MAKSPNEKKAATSSKRERKLVDVKSYSQPGLTDQELEELCPIPRSELDENGLPIPKWYKINKDLATQLLTLNYGNRVVNKAAKERYYQDMISGRWMSTHQGMLIYDNGRPGDAQHRLAAIIEADIEVWMLVTRAWNREDIHHAIDGGAMRKPGFRAEIPDAMAAAIRAWYYICGGNTGLINDVNLIRAIDSFLDGTIDHTFFERGHPFIRRSTSGAAYISYLNTDHWAYVHKMYSLMCSDYMKAASEYPVLASVMALFRKLTDWPKEGLYVHRNINEASYYAMLWLLHPSNREVTNIPTAISPADSMLAEVVSHSRQILHQIIQNVFGDREGR